MTKQAMIQGYTQYSKADLHIMGFIVGGLIYMITTAHIDPDTITLTQASRGQGCSLRFRPKKAQKMALLDTAICLGSAELVLDSKYNRGEMFEKIVTERYGQVWVKDSVPFYMDGDITVDGVKIQIKFQNASLCTSKTLERLATAQ
jgi:hypothetical protein